MYRFDGGLVARARGGTRHALLVLQAAFCGSTKTLAPRVRLEIRQNPTYQHKTPSDQTHASAEDE